MPPTWTETGPVDAPEGTTAVIDVSLQLFTVAGTRIKVTKLLLCVGPNPVPLIGTVEPTDPPDGETPVTVSDSSTVN